MRLHTETFTQRKFYTKKLLHTRPFPYQFAQNISQYILLCTTKPQSTSRYHFVLESLHKVVPSTTLHYKACTKHIPILLCTTKRSQSISLYYVALQSLHKLHKALPIATLYYNYKAHTSTTLYETGCTGTSQYYFVVQDLCKALRCTTSHCKVCTKHLPVLVCNCRAHALAALQRFALRLPPQHSTSLMQESYRHYIAICNVSSPAIPTLQGKNVIFCAHHVSTSLSHHIS